MYHNLAVMPLRTDVLSFLGKVPLPVMLCVSSLLLITLIFRLLGVFNWSDVILSFTLIIIIIFYTYYTYKLTKISMISPSLLAARQAHSNDLKKFLESFLNGSLNGSYESYINFNNNAKYNTSNLFKKWIISDWRYKDILEYHVIDPAYRKEISELCKKIERNIEVYNKSRLDLIEAIGQYITEEPELAYLKDGPDSKQKMAIYIYELYARRSSDIGMREFRDNQQYDTILANLGGREYLKDVNEEILKIKIIYEELIQQNKELINLLSPLLRYPILPGKDCEILKPLWEDDI